MIPVYEPFLERDDEDAMISAVKSGWISSIGEYISRFEEDFARYIGTDTAVCTSNGTTALHLILDALEIGRGDEVIIPDLTFIATANAVQYTGAKVITCDVEPDTLTMCPMDLMRKLSPRTKAIIPVHLYGHPANMKALCETAKHAGVHLIEDCAEAHGATFGSQRVGSFGIASAFSFYGNKVITTGEGGMITVKCRDLDKKLRLKRDHGMSKHTRYYHEVIGFNYRMTNVQAALGCSQLAKIENIISRKREIFSLYKSHIAESGSITLNFEANWAKSVFWLVNIHSNMTSHEVKQITKQLKTEGIDTRPFFVPISQNPIYSDLPICKNASRIHEGSFSLPSSPKLNADDINFISDKLNEVLKYV